MNTYFPAPQHIEASGNVWEQCRTRSWNLTGEGFRAYPGPAPLEQWMRRSKKEKRCIECGELGTVKQESVIVASVDHYYLCEPCDTYFKEKHQ